MRKESCRADRSVGETTGHIKDMTHRTIALEVVGIGIEVAYFYSGMHEKLLGEAPVRAGICLCVACKANFDSSKNTFFLSFLCPNDQRMDRYPRERGSY